MKILRKVVFTAAEPTSTNVLWVKPNGDNATIYVFKNGAWVNEKEEDADSVMDYINSQDTATLTSAKEYSDSLVGDINTILDKINGEVA